MTLTDYSTEYLAQRPELAPTTRTLFAHTFARLSKDLGAETPLADVTPMLAAQWRAGLLASGLAVSSVAAHVRRARTIWRAATSQRLAPENVFRGVSASSPATNRTAYVTPEEAERMLAVAPSPEWRRLIGLCRYAGLRVGEALRVQWKDVDLHEGTITVAADVESTKRKQRTVPIGPALMAILQKGGEPTALLCGLEAFSVHKTMHRILVRAKVTRYPKPFHSLRASLECDWLTKGFPTLFVCAWLGHTPATAMKHYVKPSKASMDAVRAGGVA